MDHPSSTDHPSSKGHPSSMDHPSSKLDQQKTAVIEAWLYDVQQSFTAPSKLFKRKVFEPQLRHPSTDTPSQSSAISSNSKSGRGRGAQRTARPAAAQLHADGGIPASTPEESFNAGWSLSSAQVQLPPSFGPIPMRSLPTSLESSVSPSAQRSTKRRRSTKAVRTPSDLLMANIPVLSFTFTSLTEVPSSLHGLVQAMRRIHQGLGTIPIPVADQVTACLGPTDPPVDPSWLMSGADCPIDESLLMTEFKLVKEIAETSEECLKDGAHDVVWNEEVHSSLLKVALEPFRGRLRRRNVTTVDILPEYLPGVGNTTLALSEVASTPNQTLQTKRVDYVIVIDDEEVRSASVDHLRRQADTPFFVESINHVSDNGFLRQRPIAISVETKTPDGGELQGRTQLGIWATAHAMRLRAALGHYPTDLALPLVLVVGTKWTVHFLVDKGEAQHLYRVPTSEDSETIGGCYRVIALIRELGRWSTDVYRPWFQQAILGLGEE